jgi:hypothetical protein
VGGEIGVKEDFTKKDNMGDHLVALDHFISNEERNMPFDGTIIRLPLRTEIGAKLSKLVQQAITANHIKEMFSKFMEKEMAVVMLFLSHLSSIELLVRDNNGYQSLASVQMSREVDIQMEETIIYSKSVMRLVKGEAKNSPEDEYVWNLFHSYANTQPRIPFTLKSDANLTWA